MNYEYLLYLYNVHLLDPSSSTSYMSSHSTELVADSETFGSMELAAKEFSIPQYVWDIANYVSKKIVIR